jgi:hypothetical protein
LERGEEGGDDDDWSTSPASSRLLFFVTPVHVLFAGDDFILQVTGVFTHIRSRAPEAGGLRWWANIDLHYFAAANEEQKGQSL